jgi:hypothetical protein
MKKIIIIVFAAFAVFHFAGVQAADTAEVDDKQAMEILQNMAKTIAGAEQFSVTLTSSYDAPQAGGQMIEYGAIRNIQVKRPDKMRIEKLRSDGDERILVFDGKEIIVHNVTENIYAKAEKTGTVDDAVKHLVSVLKTPVPLARMFRTTLPAELEQLVNGIDYVELNKLTGEPTDHLAVRTKDVDFQIWITQGEKPLPRRIVLTYKNFRGDPQFRADFSNWNLGARNVIGPFAYSPPKDAEQVPMLVRKQPKAPIPVKEGGAK